MKQYFTILIGMLFAVQVAAQKPSCDSDSYSSEVLKEEQISETCIRYEIKVSYDGTRSFGLSHYSIGIPCGEVKDFSNSENWKMVFGKDRTTGVYGLKVDDISGFGEGGADSFTVEFTWCSSNSCTKELGVVAYKAGLCVDYDTLSHPDDPDPNQTCSTLLASLQKKNITCSASNDGEMQVIIQDGQEPFVYAWSNGASTSATQNLAAGIYAVTITDANGNTLTLSEEISAPLPLVITESVVNPACSGQNNGSIVLTVSGGTGVYTYAWSNGSSDQNQSNLVSGFYTVTVTDETGCSATKTVVLTNGTLISAEVSLVHPSCTQANGSIDITPVGGTAPYTYLWSTGATTQDLQNVAAGNYLVTITDAGGCLTRKIYTLNVNNTLSLSFSITPTSCVGDNSGAIDLSVYGGTSPYTFAWLDGPTTQDRSGLTVGSYQVTVTDAKGCSAQSVISVNKRPLQVSSTINQPTCAQDLGAISVIPAGGVEPYTYSWSNGDTDNAIDGLTAGNYLVTVTDATGCSEIQSYFIVPPTAIDVTSVITNAQCGNEGSFAIDLTVMGGKIPYTYLWSNGSTSEDISGLYAGNYSVSIKDASGCVVNKEFIIDPATINWSCLINPPVTPVVCGSVGNVLSTAVIDATTYAWTVASTDNSWSITSGNNDLSVFYTAGAAGSSAIFTLLVTKNGCTQTCSYTVSGCVERDNTGGGDPTSNDPCTTQPTTPPVVVEEPKQPEVPTEEETSHWSKVNIVHAYPNPFKDKLRLEWTAPANDKVCLEIIDGHGNRQCVVYEGEVKAGNRYSFDCSEVGLKDRLYYFRYASSKHVGYGKLLRIK
ncbi:MAG: SprB repeat-containing protein [Cyclobacteriaceae bacterium]|nr:SprB repeat-containing protein [Cyclobacteriaceae bacterium]